MKTVKSPVVAFGPFGQIYLLKPRVSWAGRSTYFVCACVGQRLLQKLGVPGSSVAGSKCRVVFSSRASRTSTSFQMRKGKYSLSGRPRAFYGSVEDVAIDRPLYAHFETWAIRNLRLTATPKTFHVRVELVK